MDVIKPFNNNILLIKEFITYSAETRFFSSTVTKVLIKSLQLFDIDSSLEHSLNYNTKIKKKKK